MRGWVPIVGGLERRVRYLLGLSLLLNVVLLLVRYRQADGMPRTPLQSLGTLEGNRVGALYHVPAGQKEGRMGARLTHVVVPFHVSQEKIIRETLELWRTYPPCMPMNQTAASFAYPRSLAGPIPLGEGVTLVFYASSAQNSTLTENLLGYVEGLPEEARYCFSAVQVAFASLQGRDDSYLRGSRRMFEQMLDNQIGLQNPSHVLYMEPDVRPIRSHWLAAVDAQTRPPNAPFWMKGSLFRGDMVRTISRLVYDRLHVNGNALYALGDPNFRTFYFQTIRPFIAKYYHEGAYDTDIFKWLLDPHHYDEARHLAHLFIFSDFIQNWWHNAYSIAQIRQTSPNTVLVHGGTPRE